LANKRAKLHNSRTYTFFQVDRSFKGQNETNADDYALSDCTERRLFYHNLK